MNLRGLYLVPVGAAADAAIAGTPPAGADAAVEITKLLDGLAVGTPAEYKRIPEIWRHAIAAGKRNDAAELTRLLDLSLPKLGEPLADWQAVVIGGGVINGVTQAGDWPKRRLAEFFKPRPDLQARWDRIIELASVMTDNKAVNEGTRYDAMRIMGADYFERCGVQLSGYLAKGTHLDLQMGAVSGLCDMEAPQVPRALVSAFAHLEEENRQLAFDGLVRTPERAVQLAEAIEKGVIPRELLTAEQLKKLNAAKSAEQR